MIVQRNLENRLMHPALIERISGARSLKPQPFYCEMRATRTSANSSLGRRSTQKNHQKDTALSATQWEFRLKTILIDWRPQPYARFIMGL